MAIGYRLKDNFSEAVFRLTDGYVVGPEDKPNWKIYQDWLDEGNTPQPPDNPFINAVPSQIAMWTFRTALQNKNLFDKTQQAIDSSGNNSIKNLWEYGNYAFRDSQPIADLQELLGLTKLEMDTIFFEANQLGL